MEVQVGGGKDFIAHIILYINDIINTSTILQLILFADDTNVFVSHKDKDCLTTVSYTHLTLPTNREV